MRPSWQQAPALAAAALSLLVGQDGAAAHDSWVRSSGHHRNLLMTGWREMGSGNSGACWTQNFGFCSGDEQVGGGGPQ